MGDGRGGVVRRRMDKARIAQCGRVWEGIAEIFMHCQG